MIFYSDRISVKEIIDIKTYEHNDSFINETLSQRCDGCCVIFYNRRNFNYKEQTCDRSYKILLNADFEPKNIYVIWCNNCEYRLLTTLNPIKPGLFSAQVSPRGGGGHFCPWQINPYNSSSIHS